MKSGLTSVNLLHMVVTNFKAPLGLIKIYMVLSYPVDLAKSKGFQAFLSRKIKVSSARGAVNERVEIECGKSAVIFVVLIFDNVSYLNRIEAAPFDSKSEILFARSLLVIALASQIFLANSRQRLFTEDLLAATAVSIAPSLFMTQFPL